MFRHNKAFFQLVLIAALFVSCSKSNKEGSNPKSSSASSSIDGNKGGVFYINLGGKPSTLNPITATDAYSSGVHKYLIETLLEQDPDTYEWLPNIAESYEISKDGLVFTFKIRDGIKWHDGKPLTIEDVKFSFDVLKESDWNTATVKPYLDNIISATILDKSTIEFKADKKYFGNFSAVAGGIVGIIPKHIYEKPSKVEKKKLNKKVTGSGPYTLEKFDRNKGITLKKNPNWWGTSIARNKDVHNVDKIFLRFVNDRTVSLEMLKKGSLDYIGLGAEEYVKKAVGEGWGSKFIKVKTENSAPKGYTFLGFNLRKPLFQDKNVRLALYHLFDREKMVKKFYYDMYYPVTGPVYKQSPYANSQVKPVSFDPKKALELLEKSGWKDSDGDKILDKVIDGKKTKLSFEVLEPWKGFEKFMTTYKEDARQIGVEVKIKIIEWTSFMKLLDERNFDTVRMAWGGGSVYWEPKQIWHSSSAGKGSNFIGYNNPEVDKLIDEARGIMDHKEREPVLHKVYKMIAEDVPYMFLFGPEFGLYAHTQKMNKPKDTFKYTIGTDYWWISK